MKYKELMKYLKKRSDKGFQHIKASILAKELNITINHASKDLQRCWKMGLLCRKRMINHIKGGDFYIYYISKSGFNFLKNDFKNKEETNEDENNYVDMAILLIKNIDVVDKKTLKFWVANSLIPDLLNHAKDDIRKALLLKMEEVLLNSLKQDLNLS